MGETIPKVAISYQTDDIAVAYKVFYWLLDHRIGKKDIFFYEKQTTTANLQRTLAQAYERSLALVAIIGPKYAAAGATPFESSILEARSRRRSGPPVICLTTAPAPAHVKEAYGARAKWFAYTPDYRGRFVPSETSAGGIAHLVADQLNRLAAPPTTSPTDTYLSPFAMANPTLRRHFRAGLTLDKAQQKGLLCESVLTTALMLGIADKGRRNVRVRGELRSMGLQAGAHERIGPHALQALKSCVDNIFDEFMSPHEKRSHVFRKYASDILAYRLRRYLLCYAEAPAIREAIPQLCTMISWLHDSALDLESSLPSRASVAAFSETALRAAEMLEDACAIASRRFRWETQIKGDKLAPGPIRTFRQRTASIVPLHRSPDRDLPSWAP